MAVKCLIVKINNHPESKNALSMVDPSDHIPPWSDSGLNIVYTLNGIKRTSKVQYMTVNTTLAILNKF